MSTIRAAVNDQKLVITDAPELASGGKGTNYVAFEFCELWDGFTKTAVFYNRPSKKYLMNIGSDDSCEIPPEVTEKKGRMFFGVFGVDGDGKRKTSLVVPYFIGEGGYDEDAAPSEPTEEFWEQVLAEIAKNEAAVRDAIEALDGVKEDSEKAAEIARRHNLRHFLGGEDPIAPEDIGAAEMTHRHGTADIDGLLETEYDEDEETLELGDLFNGETVPEEAIIAAVREYLEENPPEGGSVDLTKYEERLLAAENAIADLLYEPISILSFTHDAGTRENGDSVGGFLLKYSLNKAANEMYLDGSAMGGSSGETSGMFLMAVSSDGSLDIKATKTYTLKAVDERGTEATKTTTINFYDGIYYGCMAEPAAVNSEFILSLTKKLSGGKNLTVNVTGGDNKYFWYAYPKSMGASIFNIGGFDYEYSVQTVSFTNSFGVTKDYYVYKSTQPIPGSISVTVKGG